MKKYSKKINLSYTLGVFPTLELVRYQPSKVNFVIFHNDSLKNAGAVKIKEICKKQKIPYEFHDAKIKQLSVKDNCLVVGGFNKYHQQLDAEHNHIVLINPRNMGNIGTILRTALGFGIKQVAIIKPAADYFDPKVIRSSMGAIFGIKIEEFDDINRYAENFSSHVGYSFMSDGETSLPNTDFKPPYSLIFGNESQGLPKTLRKITQSVSIPQTYEIDSFNLAMAVAIVLYEINRSN